MKQNKTTKNNTKQYKTIQNKSKVKKIKQHNANST